MDTSDHAADTAAQGFIDKVRLRQPRRPEPKQVISVRLRVEAIEESLDSLDNLTNLTMTCAKPGLCLTRRSQSSALS